MMNLYTKLSSPLVELGFLYLVMIFCYFSSIFQEPSIFFAIVPIVLYSNAGLQEKQIRKENKGKAGVYR
jgi:hypothetical protein